MCLWYWFLVQLAICSCPSACLPVCWLVLEVGRRIYKSSSLCQLQLLFFGIESLLLRRLGPLLQFARGVEPINDAANEINARRYKEHQTPFKPVSAIANNVTCQQGADNTGNGGKSITNTHQNTGMLRRNIQMIDTTRNGQELTYDPVQLSSALVAILTRIQTRQRHPGPRQS